MKSQRLDPRQLLKPGELDTVLAHVNRKQARLAIELSSMMMWRPQEMRLLNCGDLQGDRVIVPTLKKVTDDPRRAEHARRGLCRSEVLSHRPLPMSPRALALWGDLADGGSPERPLLVSRRAGQCWRGCCRERVARGYLSENWSRAWRASGLRPNERPPTFYATRHTGLSRIANLTDLTFVQDWADHASVETSRKYVHNTWEEKQALAKMLA